MALPIRPVHLPWVLVGQQNGTLPDSILTQVAGQGDGPIVRLVDVAARAWTALSEDCHLATGHTVQTTGTADSYRTLAQQRALFLDRYTLTYLPNRPTKEWQGRTYWLKPNEATAAVPGTSNHGLGLAVDIASVSAVMAWLLAHALDYGWSWELESEPWHLRYYPGDIIPPAVLAHERTSMESVELLIITTGPTKRSMHVTGYAGCLPVTPTQANARIDRGVVKGLPKGTRGYILAEMTEAEADAAGFGPVILPASVEVSPGPVTAVYIPHDHQIDGGTPRE
jgi:hypothetical protein